MNLNSLSISMGVASINIADFFSKIWKNDNVKLVSFFITSFLFAELVIRIRLATTADMSVDFFGLWVSILVFIFILAILAQSWPKSKLTNFAVPVFLMVFIAMFIFCVVGAVTSPAYASHKNIEKLSREIAASESLTESLRIEIYNYSSEKPAENLSRKEQAEAKLKQAQIELQQIQLEETESEIKILNIQLEAEKANYAELRMKWWLFHWEPQWF